MTLLALLSLATTQSEPPVFEIKLEEAHYAFRHAYPGGYALAPKNARLLVVRYRVRNSTDGPLQLDAQSVNLTLVAGDRRTAARYPFRFGDSGSRELKPGASQTEERWIEAPYNLEDPKLVFLAAGQATTIPVSDAKPDPGPWANEPATLAVSKNAPIPLGPWDVAVTRIDYPVASPGTRLPLAPDEQALVATVEFRGAIPGRVSVNSDSLFIELLDGSGKPLPARATVFDGRADARLERTVAKGARTTARVAFPIPPRFTPATLRLTEPTTGRAITIGL